MMVFETFAVVLELVLVTSLTPWLSRRRGWIGIWLLCLCLLAILWLVRQNPSLENLAPWRYLTRGRTEYLLYGSLALLLLGLPGCQIPRRVTRWAAGVLALVVCLEYSVAPFLGPLVSAPSPATTDVDGVCIQTDSFSCGPASCTTTLRRMGISADFMVLAKAAHTSQAIGTPPDLLCDALEKLYPVRARYHWGEHLPPKDNLILVLKLGLFVDHYVALLERLPDGAILIGDPLLGKTRLEKREFESRWRHTWIEIEPAQGPLTTPSAR